MKKNTYIVSFAIASSLLMSGCTQVEEGVEALDVYAQDTLASISVPFEWFKLEESTKEETPAWKTIQAVELPAVDETETHLESYQLQIAALEAELTNPLKTNGFLSRQRPAYVAFDGFAIQPETPDTVGDVIRDVDSVSYQEVSSLTLTGIGMNQAGERTLMVSLNAINDTEDFLLYPLQLTLDEKGMIADVKQLNKPTSASSTPTPLSVKSEWVEAVHGEFGHLWAEIKQSQTNSDWSAVTKSDIQAWLLLADIETPETSVEAVWKWFTANEGDLKKAEVTGYVHTDEEASAITRYEVSYPLVGSDIEEKLTIHYDRGLNKIVEIKSGSPFEQVAKGELK